MAESSGKKRTATGAIGKKKVTRVAKTILKKASSTRSASPKKKATSSLRPRAARAKKAPAAMITASLSSKPAVNGKTQVEEAKFFSGPIVQKFITQERNELPGGYNECRITLMVRDPYWLHTYWELPGWKLDEMKSLMGFDNFSRSKKIIRVYDVTDINFTGVNANSSYDIGLSRESNNWYIHGGSPNRSFCVDLGFLTEDGKFYVVARSNVVSTPRDSMSEVIDEEWLTIDWERMYALSGGFGIGKSSGEIREMLKKRLREELHSGLFSSWSRDIHKEAQREKDFWLVVNTELIVYGATEPDAKLSVQGLPVKLRPDGTFTMRFALPDGHQEIPIVALDRDGEQKRQVTPAVEKRTK